MAKIAQRQIVASIVPSARPINTETPPTPGNDGTYAYFAQVTGGEITASVEKIYIGGKLFPEVLCAPAEIGDITLTRHYDSGIDGAFLGGIRQMVGRAYYNITIEELNCELKIPGTQRTYSNSLLVGLTEPDGDAASGAPATYSLTFSIQSVGGSASVGTGTPATPAT
jgi:hypothetical protein